MKAGKLLALFVVLALLAALAGCTPAKPVSTGAFDGQSYSNDFFNLTFKLPDGWTSATREQIVEVFKLGAETLNMDEEELKKQSTIYLAYAMKHEYGYADSYNANLNVMCANLGLIGSLTVKSEEDFLQMVIDQAGKTTEGTDVTYTFGDITKQTIGGADFAVVDATLTYSGLEIKQRMFSTLKKGYAIEFALSWVDDADKAELLSVMDTVNFK